MKPIARMRDGHRLSFSSLLSMRRASRNVSDSVVRAETDPVARILGLVSVKEVNLRKNKLLLHPSRGAMQSFTEHDLCPPFDHQRGLLWSTLRIGRMSGEALRIRGLNHSDAAKLAAALTDWIHPIRARYFAEVIGELRIAESKLDDFLNAQTFVRHSQFEAAAQQFNANFQQIKDRLRAPDTPQQVLGQFEKLREALETFRESVNKANEIFVRNALKRHAKLFDTIESNPLTSAQRRACVIDDDYNLVLAGAGTGKTSVMIGRLGYLLAEQLASPESVLLVAYNRDAAKELRDRAASCLQSMTAPDRLTIKTFHALGKDLIAQAEGVQPSLSILAEDGLEFKKFVSEQLEELLKDPEYAEKFVAYGFVLNQPAISIFEIDSIEDYERELARLDLRTLRGEQVKSYQEVQIANFLLKNKIEYAYEEPFIIQTANRYRRQYRPDFTISRDDEHNSLLYLEHFGIDRNGNPPSFFDEASAIEYRESIAWKRKLYRQEELPLIETYSYEFDENVVFKRLTERLAAHDVFCETRSDKECIEILREAGKVSEAAGTFTEVLPLIREMNASPDEVMRQIESMPPHQKQRARVLWDLVVPIVDRYEKRLAETGEIDFSDMIRRAIEYLRSGRIKSKFSHILIDEFQDISRPRADLVLALARSRPESTVFCVGDDWQSIYRFTGSDIRYTSQFDELVGQGTTTPLDRTFRFNNQIGEVASRFVSKNPRQMDKQIESLRKVEKPAVSLVRTAQPHLGLLAILSRVNRWAEHKKTNFSVYVLARYHYELDTLRREHKTWNRNFNHISDLKFSTVHGAKGLEADFVVIVGLEPGRNGFPADKGVDSFRELFLPPEEEFAFAEERRLFYVALTRAKHRAYLIYDAYWHSPFIDELESGEFAIEKNEFTEDFIQPVLPTVPCPRCSTGRLRPRSGEHGTFFGCDRFPICRYRERGCGTCKGLLLRADKYRVCSDTGCDGVHLACPKCGAPMVHRTSQYGEFFGCSNYGRVDLIEQCSAKQKWTKLPGAEELRRESP